MHSAKGIKAYLIKESFSGKFLIRVYDDQHNFKDYDILHFDLEVLITDDSATFFDSHIGYTPEYRNLE